FFRADIIITCHNYGRYLEQAINSAIGQGNVIVVDDASTDDTETIAKGQGVQYFKVNFKDRHKSRMFGVAKTSLPYVHFLDADNYLSPNYIAEGLKLFQNNPRLAIVYPDLQEFGAADRLVKFDPIGLENRNYIDAGSIFLREAIAQANIPKASGTLEDWWFARQILRFAPWEVTKNPIPLNYRRHEEQYSNTFSSMPYGQQANLKDEEVTIFTSISDRILKNPTFWSRRIGWINMQTWPNLRLVVANTTDKNIKHLFTNLRVPYSFYNQSFPNQGLEDINRIGNASAETRVQTVVAAIYNRMWKETSTEYVLVLENDVFPEPLNTIEKLMQGVAPNVCAVSGAYKQRYPPYGWTIYKDFNAGRPLLLPTQQEGIEDIRGAGFGCLLVRRSQMAHEVIKGNTPLSRYYDADIFERLVLQGKKVKINWDVICDHVGKINGPQS
ncbi:MAG: glycosyltransferase family 2 protein, partial [Patescibacteria group bacterium]|nr:glycosyltransferase family 2 protein [Patescibacteria group bacterium]